MNNKKVYVFHREDMFYPIELDDDIDAINNANFNEGTTKVEDIEGNIIWRKNEN